MKRKILWCFGYLSGYDKNISLIEKLHSENIRLIEEIEIITSKKKKFSKTAKSLWKENKKLKNELNLVV